jgi:hypothetical protein
MQMQSYWNHNAFKLELAKEMNAFLRPFRENIDFLVNNPSEIYKQIKLGAITSRRISRKTIEILNDKLGFKNLYK